MKVLLDTNILIHRETTIIINPDIGQLFFWIDRLGYEKCIHPASLEEIDLYQNAQIKESFQAKLKSYYLLKIESELDPTVIQVCNPIDTTDNSKRDTRILNELFNQRVDLLITEDKGIHEKAGRLNISDKVFTIEGFLEKAISENPELVDYKVLAVKKTLFGRINLADTFFDSFREDYPGFDNWFNKKSEEPCYVSELQGTIVAFLYLKVENQDEPYSNIIPSPSPKKRLKIGTFKVVLNGFKLGERFLKIIFDNAILQNVSEIYVTIFPEGIEKQRLINLLHEFGFVYYGVKQNSYGDEEVHIRNMRLQIDNVNPRKTYPYLSNKSRKFLVPIYPEYHTELLPDSILNTESPTNFIEQKPHRNAIRKVYISRSIFRDLLPGDIIVFYRTGGYHKSVLTTIGLVEKVYNQIPDLDTFIKLCRKRSVFSDDELKHHWEYSKYGKPFIVEFLYVYSFPKRPNLKTLIDNKIINDISSAPRGFERINNEKFNKILRLAEADQSLVID